MDLVYVAATYKLGSAAADELVKIDCNFKLLGYAVVVLAQLVLCWHFRTTYDNRILAESLLHKALNFIEILVIAVAVVYSADDLDDVVENRR